MNKKILIGLLGTIIISFIVMLISQLLNMPKTLLNWGVIIEKWASLNWGVIIEKSMTLSARVSVPVVLAIWTYMQKEQDKKHQKRKEEQDKEYQKRKEEQDKEHQKRKEKELQRKDEKDFLLNYVREELISLRITPDKLKLLSKEEIETHLNALCFKFIDLESIIQYSSYNYMCEYFNFLISFILAITSDKKLSLKDLREGLVGFYVSIIIMLSLVLMKQDDYKNTIPVKIIDPFMRCGENVEKIMLVELKKKYPNDYDTIVMLWKIEKNKIVKMETINE